MYYVENIFWLWINMFSKFVGFLVGSFILRESMCGCYINVGFEIGVVSIKVRLN